MFKKQKIEKSLTVQQSKMFFSFRKYKTFYCVTNTDGNVVKVREHDSYVKIGVRRPLDKLK